MRRLTLVVDERELSTIQAALPLLQEQINALPEDLADMLTQHAPAMTEKEIGRLVHRLTEEPQDECRPGKAASGRRYAVEVTRSGSAAVSTG
jgi:hypothetical protein